MTEKLDYEVVVAIDIGHTHTGYAYAFVCDSKIQLNFDWGNVLGIPSTRTSTSVMIGPNGKAEEFGIEAEYKYSKLCGLNEKVDIYLFRHFNMQLIHQEVIKHETQVISTCGKKFGALEIFAMTLGNIHRRLQSDMAERKQSPPDKGRVKWILTHPANWSDGSKLFLREAACKAGLIPDISSHQLVLMKETEAIALYCQSLSPVDFLDQGTVKDGVHMKAGSQYLVVDAGGGSVTLTAFEVTHDGVSAQLCPSVLLAGCGADSVNKSFIQLLEQIFGGKFTETYSKKNPDFWFQHIHILFEKKKRSIKPNGEDVLKVPLTKNIELEYQKEIGENIGDRISKFKGRGVYSKESDLILNPTAIFELHQSAFNKIKPEIAEFLSQKSSLLKGLTHVFLVGGFAESEFLRKSISASLSKYEVIVPKCPGTVVVKSAVWYGLNPGAKFQAEVLKKESQRVDESEQQDCIPSFDKQAIGLEEDQRNFKLVCALDFGTTYSGYAYGYRDDVDDIILNKEWNNQLGLASLKNATSVLTDPSGQFEEFGFDAEFKYSKLCAMGDAAGRDLYRHFKMLLHKAEDVTRESMVTSTRGTERPAFDIFVMALEYLKNHFLNAVKEKDGGEPHMESIRWVITVPAIWSDKAKQFMREAAYQAHLITDVNSKQLIFALEPEAAALYCQALSMDKNRFQGWRTKDQALRFDKDTKYMIIDAGGGTVDITVQQVLEDGKIKELQSPSGGDWGGNKINAKFQELMETIFGQDFIKRYQTENPDSWLELEVAFEKKKRANSPNGQDTITFQITRNFERSLKKITGQDIDAVVGKCRTSGVYIRNDDLVIDPSAVVDLYHSTFALIIPRVTELLNSPKLKDLKHIFLVGGFAESEFLKKAIQTEFQKYLILTPEHSGTAVLRGAVIFGHNTEIVISRIAKKNYGIAINIIFVEGEHNKAKKIIDENGKAYCEDVFETYITKGEDINVGDFKTFTLHPFSSRARCASLKLYCTDKDDVVYVDDDGVQLLAEMEVPMGHQHDGKRGEITTKVSFGGTEIIIEGSDVQDRSQVERAQLNCFCDSKISYPIQKHKTKR